MPRLYQSLALIYSKTFQLKLSGSAHAKARQAFCRNCTQMLQERDLEITKPSVTSYPQSFKFPPSSGNGRIGMPTDFVGTVTILRMSTLNLLAIVSSARSS
jgi:hypothetical protein